MKRRTKLAVKSVVGARKGMAALNQADRESYVAAVAEMRALPDNVVTPLEAGLLFKASIRRNDVVLCEEHLLVVTEAINDRWGEPDERETRLPIGTVLRTVVAAYTVADSESEEAARAALPGVLDAVALYEVDPLVGESYKVVTRAGEGDEEASVDMVKLSRNVRNDLAQLREDWPATVDEYYKEQVYAGGIAYANRAITALRVLGGVLPMLVAEQWNVQLMSQDEYTTFMRQAAGRYSCLNPFCGNCAEVYPTWGELEQDDVIEGGKVALLTRREESPLTREMVTVARLEAPSIGTDGLWQRDVAFGFEVHS
jgi:hypothetical protein